jgi:hypothetical protein
MNGMSDRKQAVLARWSLSVILVAAQTLSTANAEASVRVVGIKSAVEAADSSLAALGGQVSAQKAAEADLRQLGEPIHRAKVAAVDIVQECRRNAGLYEGGEIDFIGTDIIPFTAQTSEGFGPTEYLPPRRKYLNMHLNQLNQVIELLDEDISSLSMPDQETKDKVASQLDAMTGLMGDVKRYARQLKTMCKQSSLNNRQIINSATGLHEAISDIDKARKQVYEAIKHDPDTDSQKTATPPAS